MSNKEYQLPVTKLLEYGACSSASEWPNYVQELDFKEEHIPELIRMMTDEGLQSSQLQKSEIWAPVHAWRTLAQLGTETATTTFLEQLEDPLNDWAHAEIPIVLGLIGPAVIPEIQQYLANPSGDLFGRISAVTSLKELQKRHPQEREQCIDIISQQLAQLDENPPDLNGFLISGLCDLKATEKAPEIERAFAAKCVDLSIMGDWDEAQVQLGLKSRKEVPIRRFSKTEVLGPMSDILDSLTEIMDPLDLIQLTQYQKPVQGFGSKSPQKKSKKSKRKKR